jgi:small membrane protein
MIAQIGLSLLLGVIVIYAWTQYSRAAAISSVALLAAAAGLYFVWLPEHATRLAAKVGIGRGVDLILYVWVIISLLVMLNLHLKLRSQMELITALAREVAIANARAPTATK